MDNSGETVQSLGPGSYHLRGEPVIVFRHSSGTQMRSVAAQQQNEGAEQVAQTPELDRALYESDFLRREFDALKNDHGELLEQTKLQSEELELLRHEKLPYRDVLEDKTLQCAELKSRLEELEQKLAAKQGTGWGLGHFLPASWEGQRPYETDTAKLRKETDGYEQGMRRLVAENDRLQQQMSEQQRQMDAQTAEFAQELEAIKSRHFINVPKVTDTAIRSDWEALGFSIRQFVAKYLPDSLDLPTVQQLAQDNTFSWLPQMSKTLQSSMLCPILLGSWIWHFLYIRIFGPSSKFWAGSIGKGLRMQYEKLYGEEWP